MARAQALSDRRPFAHCARVVAWAVVTAAPALAVASPILAQSPMGQATPATSPGALSDRERAIHLLNRATYGARVQDVDQVMRMGRAAWIELQLHPETIQDFEYVKSFGRSVSGGDVIQTEIYERRAEARGMAGAPTAPEMLLLQADALASDRPSRVTRAAPASRTFLGDPVTVAGLTTIKLARALYSERQLEEVMTDFWFNHFNVDEGKSLTVQRLLYDYQETAIRPHVFGRFEDMLRATAQHAAMMLYLDNASSSSPNALPIGKDPYQKLPEKPVGLNENYARELMELHTLGVDGGYTQLDVTELARVLTGWGIAFNGMTPTFEFDHARHDVGAKVLLGHSLRAGRAQEEGFEMLHVLATHPSTARFIATKLVRHFVADDPPAVLVDHVARVFRETDGDLREVTRALFSSEDFYDATNYRAKVKRPFEFVASTLRISEADVDVQVQLNSIVTQLEIFHHVPYSAAAPTGYPDVADDWVGASAMLERLNFTLDMLGGAFAGVVVDPDRSLGDLVRTFGSAATPDDQAAVVLRRTLLDDGRAQAASLRAAMAGESARLKGSDAERVTALLGLAMGSPAFQRY